MIAAKRVYRYFGRILPDETRESIDRYVQHGIPTGGFLQAVIDNDLCQAVSRADERHMELIPAIVGYLYNECPTGCWGRPNSFEKWIEHKRSER